MRLFFALFRRKHMPNGNIHRGKDKLIKKVTGADVQKLNNKLAIEEENMFYLRHSYLTAEQSFGHAKALGKSEQRMQRLISIPKEFRENVTLEDRLGHLRYKEAWE